MRCNRSAPVLDVKSKKNAYISLAHLLFLEVYKSCTEIHRKMMLKGNIRECMAFIVTLSNLLNLILDHLKL